MIDREEAGLRGGRQSRAAGGACGGVGRSLRLMPAAFTKGLKRKQKKNK